MLTALISKEKKIIQSEKKATCRYSKISYSLRVFVKFYLLSLFLNHCCIGPGAMIIFKINSDPDDKDTSM
jgi:hypothetical protein